MIFFCASTVNFHNRSLRQNLLLKKRVAVIHQRRIKIRLEGVFFSRNGYCLCLEVFSDTLQINAFRRTSTNTAAVRGNRVSWNVRSSSPRLRAYIDRSFTCVIITLSNSTVHYILCKMQQHSSQSSPVLWPI